MVGVAWKLGLVLVSTRTASTTTRYGVPPYLVLHYTTTKYTNNAAYTTPHHTTVVGHLRDFSASCRPHLEAWIQVRVPLHYLASTAP